MKIINTNVSLPRALSADKVTSNDASFGQLFQQLIDEAVTDQVTASELSRQLALGETDQIHSVMIATEKAALSWQLLQQVRNKLLEAYQEVMRMQV